MFILQNVCKLFTTEKFCVGAVKFLMLKCVLLKEIFRNYPKNNMSIVYANILHTNLPVNKVTH